MLTFLTGQGYVFLTDMVCGPQNWCASPTMQGFVLSSIIPFAFLSMFLLARRYMLWFWAATAGALYACNPYVYERLLAGHWRVAMGYAVFPALAAMVTVSFRRRHPLLVVMFSVAFALVVLISPHWAYMGGGFLLMLAVVTLGVGGFPLVTDPKREWYRRWEVMLAALLVPFFVIYGVGSSVTLPSVAGLVWGVTESDFRAFATVADPVWGVWGNVLNLYGFWIQDALLPKDFFGLWFLIGPMLLILSVIGLYDRIRQGDYLAITCALMLPSAIVIAVGYGSPITEPTVRQMMVHLPGFSGLRETAKAVGGIAFVYALYAPLGLRWLILRHGGGMGWKRAGAIALTFLALISGNGVLGNFHGQVAASEHPLSWYEADALLLREHATGILSLPWKAYVSTPMSGGRIIAHPARAFFTPPVISARLSNREYDLASENTPLDPLIASLVQGTVSLRDAKLQLMDAGVSHVLLSKVEDWQRYSPFFTPDDCEMVLNRKELLVCRLK